MVADELEHRPLLHLEHVQRQRSDGDAHHFLVVIEELDRLRVERKVVRVLVEEEVNGVAVQLERQGLQERDVVGHHLFVGEIEFMYNDRVHVVVREKVVCERERTGALAVRRLGSDSVGVW